MGGRMKWGSNAKNTQIAREGHITTSATTGDLGNPSATGGQYTPRGGRGPSIGPGKLPIKIEDLLKRPGFPNEIHQGEFIAIGEMKGRFKYIMDRESDGFSSSAPKIVLESEENGEDLIYLVEDLLSAGGEALPNNSK